MRGTILSSLFISIAAISCGDHGSSSNENIPQENSSQIGDRDNEQKPNEDCSFPNVLQENGECAISCNKLGEKYYCLSSDDWPSDKNQYNKVKSCSHGLFKEDECHNASIHYNSEYIDIKYGDNKFAELSLDPIIPNLRLDNYGNLKYSYSTEYPKFPFSNNISKDFNIVFSINRGYDSEKYWTFSLMHMTPNGDVFPDFEAVSIKIKNFQFKTGKTSYEEMDLICRKMQDLFPNQAWTLETIDWEIGDTRMFAYDCKNIDNSSESIFAKCNDLNTDCKIVRVGLSGT